MAVAVPAFVTAQRGPQKGEWRAYAGDSYSQKYSPLDQINRDNVKNLRIAWRWKSDNFGPRAEYNLEATPDGQRRLVDVEALLKERQKAFLELVTVTETLRSTIEKLRNDLVRRDEEIARLRAASS